MTGGVGLPLGVERLPADWTTAKLKHIAQVESSNVDKKSHDDEMPVRLCNYTDVYYNDRITRALSFMEATRLLVRLRGSRYIVGTFCSQRTRSTGPTLQYRPW